MHQSSNYWRSIIWEYSLAMISYSYTHLYSLHWHFHLAGSKQVEANAADTKKICFGEWLLKKITKEFVGDHCTSPLQRTSETQTLPTRSTAPLLLPSFQISGWGLPFAVLISWLLLVLLSKPLPSGRLWAKKVSKMVALLPWEDYSFSLKFLPLRFGKLWVLTSFDIHSCFQKFHVIEAVKVRSGPIR